MKMRFLFAVLIASSCAVAPAAFAEDAMSKPTMAKDKINNAMDKMDKKTDAMSNSSDKMKKSDGMMDKKDSMSKDSMKK